jgi:glycosyltransferase involved in cell wall biosynthesis
MNKTIDGITKTPEIFCSTIIPTVGRTTLTRAVESVLNQDFLEANFEVIVVNDSGLPLPDARWQQSERVQIINTNKRERSVARNTGAAIASGQYLHFLDDDDWMAPQAFQHFYALSQSTSAQWLYGITQLVDRQDQPTIQLQHGLNGPCFLQVMAGEWIPLQSSLVDRGIFMKAGGFNALISGPEDIDLLRRVLLETDIAEMPELAAYVVRGEEGSTTDYSQHAHASRWAREAIIESPNAFARMRTSAPSPFWHGRMLRVYLTSLVWNLKQNRFFTAASRLLHALASIVVANRFLFTNQYWSAISGPYQSFTFERGYEAVRHNEKMEAAK